MENLLLLGCGHQGKALLHRWILKNPASAFNSEKEIAFHIVQPSLASQPEFSNQQHIHFYKQAAEIESQPFAAMILAVRPAQLATALPPCQHLLGAETLILSIVNGATPEQISQALGQSAKNIQLVRAMPNLAVKIGEGVSAAFAEQNVTRENIKRATALLEATGLCVWLQSPAQLPQIVALSSCGPAYIFAFAEAMQEAAIKLGLSAELAAALTRQTLRGAALLAAADKRPLAAQWQAMALPGFSTSAAMEQFNAQSALKNLVQSAMQAAHDRAQNLADSSQKT